MDREALAWAAGLFDGEGYIGYCVSGGYGHLRVTVGQKDPEVLYRFNKAIGGFGRVSGPSNGMWAVNFYTFERGQAVIALLWRWLATPKRRQACGALRAYLDYSTTVRCYRSRQ